MSTRSRTPRRPTRRTEPAERSDVAPSRPPPLRPSGRRGRGRPSADGHDRRAVDGLNAFYGDNARGQGRRRSTYARQQGDGDDRPVGLRQVDAACAASTACTRRSPARAPRAAITLDGHDIYGADVDVVAVRRAIGMVFQKPNPFPTMSIFDNVAAGPAADRHEAATTSTSASSSRCAAPACGTRSRTGSATPGHRPLGRPAAAAVHRAHDRRRARGDPHGRAVLGARPDRDAEDRGADRRAQAALHDRDRHAQHAAGRARGRHDRVHAQRRARRARRRPRRSSPTPTTRARRSTSPGSSADGRDRRRASTSSEELARARGRRRSAGSTWSSSQLDRALEALAAPGRRAGGDGRSPTTTASTAATSRCTRGSCRCSRCRRRWPPTCGSSPRCCT